MGGGLKRAAAAAKATRVPRPKKEADPERKCYLCEREIIQKPGQEFKLICEKGAPITVCEDCYEDADQEF